MPLGQQQQSTPAPAAPAPAPAQPASMPNVVPPTRPFAAPRMQRNSPASSTGDSSSGPAPLTPRDGSDFGSGSARERERERDAEEKWSGGVSGLVPRRIAAHQRRSVSFDFEEDVKGDGKGKAKAKAKPHETPLQEEERRRERRRSEAKAAIEVCLVSSFFLFWIELIVRRSSGMSLTGPAPLLTMTKTRTRTTCRSRKRGWGTPWACR